MVTELIRSLPKPIRRDYVPAPNFAKRFLSQAVPLQEPLATTLARELKRMVGVPVTADDFGWYASRPPEDHLPDRRRAAPQAGRGQGPLDPAAPAEAEGTQGDLAGRGGDGGARGRRVPGTHGTDGLDDRHTAARVFETRRAGQPVKAYPALVDDGPTADTVSVRLFDTEAEQAQAMGRAPGG